MKLFMFKAFLLASLMFLSVLFGMQLANDGIHRMRGFHDENFDSQLLGQEQVNDNFQSSLSEEDPSSHDLERKKENMEENSRYNFFSATGKRISEGISTATEKTIDKISELFN
ncbi:DUF3679 domain-containing protein [Bacillaceae bacterium Marseille-Q3522]|nr:DUF3679 domain-containing protein [Bacillaceae bacterium Marseille-Q3522]